MTTVFYKGHHSDEVRDLVRDAISGQISLVLVPPHLQNLNGLNNTIDFSDVEFRGIWEFEPKLESGPSEVEFAIGVFTSGTTSETPKLVLMSANNIQSSIEQIFSFFDGILVDSVYTYPQPYHVFGAVLGYALSVIKDVPLHFQEGAYSKESHEAWFLVAQQFPNLITMGTPTHFKDLANYLSEWTAEAPPTRSSIAGGALVDLKTWDLMKDTLKIELPSVGYGCTEACPGVTHLTPGVRPQKDGHLGRALPGMQIEIRQGEGTNIKGDNVCVATIENGVVELKNEHLIPDELQLLGSDYFYAGRNNLVLNRGGEKFSLEKFDSVLTKAIQQTVVAFPVPHARLGEDLGLAVETSSNDSSQLKSIGLAIRSALQNEFHREFDLDHIFYIEKLPQTPNSKVDRRALTAMAQSQLNRRSRDTNVTV